MVKDCFNISKSIIISILLCLLVTTCLYSGQSNPDSADEDIAEKIKEIRSKPAEFFKIDPGILKMEGKIVKGTYELYLSNMDESIKFLIVNSTGGDTNEGVKMGLDILDRGLIVIVDGMAGSSAANYIFLAGKKKIIKRGFVAFHGNATALINSEGWDNMRDQVFESIGDMIADHGIDFNEFFSEYRKEWEETMSLESRFLERIKVSQAFFDLTQTDGMGLCSDLGYSFDFLIPSPATLEKWGIYNVEGVSDVRTAELVGIKAIYY